MKKFLLGLTLSFALVSGVFAGTILQTHSIGSQVTDFHGSISFDSFNDLGGKLKLQSVFLNYEGQIDNVVSVESLDAKPVLVTTNLNANMTISSDIGLLLDFGITPVTDSFQASSFDGVIDFSGTSGGLISNSNVALSGSDLFTQISILDYFEKNNPNFYLSTVVTSYATGAGNLLTQFNTNTLGTLSLKYNYVEVSSPSLLSILRF